MGHLFAEVTYPRFLSVNGGMLFTYRIGKYEEARVMTFSVIFFWYFLFVLT